MPKKKAGVLRVGFAKPAATRAAGKAIAKGRAAQAGAAKKKGERKNVGRMYGQLLKQAGMRRE